MANRYLVLENGTTFTGKAFGADKSVIGEVVFETSMIGYIETLTDPSYYGQIVTQTFPSIGNYGIINEDFQSSSPKLFAYIVKSHSTTPSNYRIDTTLDKFLKDCNIPGIYGIDTRALTRTLREIGVMNGMVTDDLASVNYDTIRDFSIKNALEHVSTQKVYSLGNGKKNVVLLDLGYRNYIAKELTTHGYKVTIMPYDSTAEQILAQKPSGIILSNGPGDPTQELKVIETICALLPHKIPTMGIGLGHQLLALANGFEVVKLKYGHRGSNQPSREIATGRIYATSQNHGFSVVESSINQDIAKPSFINVNDQACEGIEYTNIPAFSVQFYPNGSDVSTGTNFLFDNFYKLMEVK